MQRIDNILRVYEKNGFVISEKQDYKHKQPISIYNAILEKEIKTLVGHLSIGDILKGANQDFTKDNGGR